MEVAALRGRFWQQQIPMTILGADQAGIHTTDDLGQSVTFPDQTAVDFFLLGYRMGQHAETAALPTEEAPAESEVASEQEPE